MELPPPLRHRFRIIAFDWDGTAVPDRHADASTVRAALVRLLRAGVRVGVITGTNFQNIDRQFSAAVSGPYKRRLFILTNRGSEVYGFDAASRPVLLWRREATPEEDRRLTETADAVRDAVEARTGLEVGVVYDRLNRRKIDLIPLPAWRDPPKSRIGELRQAVESRLRGAGLSGGLAAVFRLTRRTARAKGLIDARITSDVKHIEVGLTDKSDSVAWLMRELAAPAGIPPDRILILGDEFGDIDGFEGSDARLIIRDRSAPIYVSVGPEPGGVPPEVIHLGGGPERFLALMERQASLAEEAAGRSPGSRSRRARGAGGRIRGPPAGAMRDGGNAAAPPVGRAPAVLDRLAIRPEPDPPWRLVEEGFDAVREHEVESLFAVANGSVGVRGSLPEGTPLSAPAAFVAGVFASGPEAGGASSLLVIPPAWLSTRVTVDGHALRLDRGEALEHRRILDLRQGILWREWRHRDPSGGITRLRFLRLASLADRNLMIQSLILVPENYTGQVVIQTRLAASDSLRLSAAPRAVPLHLERAEPVADPAGDPWNALTLLLGAPGDDATIAITTAGRLRANRAGRGRVVVRGSRTAAVAHRRFEARRGTRFRLDRFMVIHASRQTDPPAPATVEHLRRAAAAGPDAAIRAHIEVWRRRWHDADVEIEGDDAAQRALRFACYHLISAANPEDERVSIGARALSGEAYRGHVFWDVESFMLPFFTLTHPPSARALLMYRYHTLPAAREKARQHGFHGAFYAWESTDTGEESTPRVALGPDGEVIPIRNGEQEVHISADIAHAVWQYWRATADETFFRDAGAEILLETARFWASRGRWREDGLYHIEGVTGPDEYHEDVDDDAFTNHMASWNLERGAEAAAILQARWPTRWHVLEEQLGLTREEIQEWTAIAAAVYDGSDRRTGLIEQCRGYFDLEDLDLALYEPRTVPMDVILGHERIRRSRIIKQPDVIMLFHLLGDRYTPRTRAVNFRYYEPRTGHGSSLSPSIHALLAARVGDLPLAERYFRQAAEIDLADNMGNAAGGIHAAALGGLWQAVVFGFAGLRMHDRGLMLDPRLPPGWRALRFPIRWRGRSLRVRIEDAGNTTAITLQEGAGIRVGLDGGPQVTARSGRHYVSRRRGSRWDPWQTIEP